MISLIQKLLEDLGCKNVEIGIVFTDDTEIKRLNQRYRGKNKTTDVLSFSLPEGTTDKTVSHFLGDIVISLPTTKRQAKEYNYTIAEEVLRLLIHGTLHLCGYEHEGVSSLKARKMLKVQEKLWNKFCSEI